ncbi:MAG: hypothetical protein FIB00_02395 [Chloroflexi bacterium]|nr:hypothetical protein [Chloroflexota bacterium]PWB46713.1 MAG: hypothetical protein C3F10_03740 [Dehalococcoidia bacterium]
MAITREDIARAIEPLRPDIAEALGDRKSSGIERIECPALSRYRVYMVTVFAPHAPIVHYIAYAEDGPPFVLSEDPDAFVAMAAADGGVEIASASEAAAYAEVFLTVTRPLSELSYLVKTLKDVSFRPGLGPDEAAARKDFERTYGPVIKPPAGRKAGDGFEVTAYRVVEQSLERMTLQVSRSGEIESSDETLEEDLPLVIGGA